MMRAVLEFMIFLIILAACIIGLLWFIDRIFKRGRY